MTVAKLAKHVVLEIGPLTRVALASAPAGTIAFDFHSSLLAPEVTVEGARQLATALVDLADGIEFGKSVEIANTGQKT